ncbi:MAG: PHP domain-containing protein [Acidobacteriota bacterium]
MMTGLLVALATVASGANHPERALRAAFHVHTTFSDGSHTVVEVARFAAEAGIDVVILNDHFMDQITYGLPLLREAFALRVTPPSLAPRDMDAYLEATREAERETGVIVLPGVELTPFYYWQGNPLSGNLTLNSAHRHLLVVFSHASDIRNVSETLPTVSSPAGRRFGPATLLLLWPLLPGFWAARRLLSPPLEVRRTRFFIVKRKRRPLVAWVVAVASMTALVRSWPFTVPRWDPYAGDAGTAPYQEAIDAAAARGLSFWAHPETSTAFRHARYPVNFYSAPYTDFVLRADRATGFASLYEGHRKAAAPGGVWDQASLAFLAGRREGRLFTIGELDLHQVGESGGKFFGEVETVLWSRERSRAGVLKALRSGSMYAVRQTLTSRVLLDRFEAACDDGVAVMGEGLSAGAPCRLEATLHGEGEPGQTLTLALLRNGEVLHEQSVEIGRQPIELSWAEKATARRPVFYRLIGTAGNRPVLYSNPVFVYPGEAAP